MESVKKRLKKPFRHTTREVLPRGRNPARSVSRLFPEGKIYGLREVHVPEDATVDIVFLHGLNGRADTTFLHESSGTYWPVDLLPKDVPNARVSTFGYDAQVTAFVGPVGQNGLQDHASNLVNDLANKRSVDSSAPPKIVFVAHSLGGLVVKSALTFSQASAEDHLRQIEKDTLGVVFLGTPHRGSDLAPFTKAVANILKSIGKRTNTDILEVLRRNSQLLALVEDNFANWLRKSADRFRVACFFEELELPAVGRVVERESATIAGWPKHSIRANHMDMVRFAASDDDGYQQISGELKRWVQQVKDGLENERRDCLRTLYFEEWNARETRIDDVNQGGDWLSSHKEYQDWIESPSSDLLWIEGKPGSGKSTLTKRIVQRWRDEHDASGSTKTDDTDTAPTTIISAFYYSFRGGLTEISHELMLRSITYQIWQQDERLFPLIVDSYRKLGTSDRVLQKSTLFWEYHDLKHVLQCLHQVDFPLRIFLVADGMDESDNARRSDLLSFLEKLSAQTSNCVMKILIASRPETDINTRLRRSHHIILQEENMGDIRKVVARYFKGLENRNIQDNITMAPWEERIFPNEFRVTEDYIVRNSEGVFLWVALVLRDLDKLIRKGAYTTASLEKRVRKLPKELGGPNGFYHAIIQSLIRQQEDDDSLDENDKDDEQRRARTILTWATFARRSISLIELEGVLATPLEIDNTSLADYDLEQHRPRELERGLISHCGGLVEVRHWRGARVVQLAHQTVREFLLDRNRLAKPYDLDETGGDILIASMCSSAIRTVFGAASMRMESNHEFSQIDMTTTLLEGNSLLRYSLYYFKTHLVDIGDKAPDILRVFDSFIRDVMSGPRSYAALLLSRWILDLQLLETQFEVTLKDAQRCLDSALVCAVDSRRANAVLTLLVPLGANANTPGGRYGSLIQTASYHNDEMILSRLLAAHADINAQGGQFGNALQAASYRGHRNIVDMLLKCNVHVNDQCGPFGSALQAAAHQGHQEIVELLLDHGAKAYLSEASGHTALSRAVKNGHEGIAKLLRSELNATREWRTSLMLP
ncbi:hypothetical protein NPX13_g6245 [Xylaria arbuscula]|uniref:NACHT domain-containing protein n=1 Tax=Xylaria arbuscula TaxID=114810 RepID=A0A9W8NCT3_9PEZI|nr:hypothetical protein NPX13_g6245 [Xylaria arbuscula]